MSDYLSKDDDTEIEMRDTPEGVAVSLRMIEDNMVMAGTTFYLTLQQVKDMGAWLSERSEATQITPEEMQQRKDSEFVEWLNKIMPETINGLWRTFNKERVTSPQEGS